MNKVYLITYNILDWWDIYYICDSLKKAENKLTDLRENIRKLKENYCLLYQRDYDEDLYKITIGVEFSSQDDYERIVEEFYDFQHSNKVLQYENINIEEKEVI